MSGAAVSIVAPRLGLYRSDPLPPRWADGRWRPKRLYLALLPRGRFVRALGAVSGFDFAAYVEGVSCGLERRSQRVSVVGGRHFHHLGDYTVGYGQVRFTARLTIAGEVFVQRWSMEAVTTEFLVGRGEVYRWYQHG